MTDTVSIAYSSTKKRIEIIKIEKEVMKILLLIYVMSMESRKKKGGEMQENLYVIKQGMECFRKKATKRSCFVEEETDIDFEFVFLLLRLMDDIFESKNVEMKTLEAELSLNKSLRSHEFKYKKKNHPLKNSIKTSTNILKEEIFKITEINLQLQYLESSISSIGSIQSNLKGIVDNFQKNKRHITENSLESFEIIIIIPIVISLLVLTIWFMVNIN